MDIEQHDTDEQDKEEQDTEEQEIANVIAFLTHIPDDGEIAFPYLGVEVKTVKGPAMISN